MSREAEEPRSVIEARFKFSVIAKLIAAPPASGKLAEALRELEKTIWTCPFTGLPVDFGFSTIERWYYAARDVVDPIGALLRRRRSDAGSERALTDALKTALFDQHKEHSSWSVQLHHERELGRSML